MALRRPLGVVLNMRRKGELSVEDVEEGSNAHTAGVKVGDVLLRVEPGQGGAAMMPFNAAASDATVRDALDYISLCGAKDREIRLKLYRLHTLSE